MSRLGAALQFTFDFCKRPNLPRNPNAKFMTNSNLTSNARLILRSIGRVMWCAVAGAVYIGSAALVLSFAGGLCVSFLSYYESRGSVSPSAWVVYVTFLVVMKMTSIGLVAAFFAFGAAGIVFCFSDYSDNLLGGALESSLKPVFFGSVGGALLGGVNSFLWRHTVFAAFCECDCAINFQRLHLWRSRRFRHRHILRRDCRRAARSCAAKVGA